MVKLLGVIVPSLIVPLGERQIKFIVSSYPAPAVSLHPRNVVGAVEALEKRTSTAGSKVNPLSLSMKVMEFAPVVPPK